MMLLSFYFMMTLLTCARYFPEIKENSTSHLEVIDILHELMPQLKYFINKYGNFPITTFQIFISKENCQNIRHF